MLVYCLIDCIQADSLRIRNLSKTTWVFLIVLLPIAGAVAWLVAGRPERAPAQRSVPWPATRTAGFPEYERPRPARGPDDDEAFLADLRASDAEHEKLLADWEADLRAREAGLRAEAGDAAPSAGQDAATEREGEAGHADDEGTARKP
nr:PLD nuclease N-terminal domain-containing protein [Cellulomonas sp. APG4]